MYGIFTYIWLFLMVEYGKRRYMYQSHGCYGTGDRRISEPSTVSHHIGGKLVSNFTGLMSSQDDHFPDPK